MNNHPKIVVLGTADWNQKIATNQHYVVREIAKEFPVTFIESLGLRQPKLTKRDLLRIRDRLFGKSKGGSERAIPSNVAIISPKILPFHTTATNTINKSLLNQQIRNLSGQIALDSVLWTYTPVTYDLEEQVSRTVYHCVDLLGEFPGIDRKLIQSNERRLAQKGVLAIASSNVVEAHLRLQGFNDVLLWPNVADVRIFQDNADRDLESRAGAIFAGNLTANKVDFELLEAVLEAGLPLDIAGPISEGGGASVQRSMKRLTDAGAKYHGSLDLPELARIAGLARVGIIPYVDNAYTRGVSPLKTYEYLAAGLGVVSTPIPGALAHNPDAVVASGSQNFVSAVGQMMHEMTSDTVSRRQNTAQGHSWELRGHQVRTVLRSLVHGVSEG